MDFGFRANVCIPAKNYLMGLWKLKIKQSRHGGVLDTKWLVEEIQRGRYDFGQPSEGHALDICLCSDTHQRCNLQHAFGRDNRCFLLLSYCSLPQRTEEKKYRVLSNFSTTVSYVIYVFIQTAPSALLYWGTWPRRKPSVVRVTTAL